MRNYPKALSRRPQEKTRHVGTYVRAISPGDEGRLRGMFSRLSSGTIYRRFHAPYPRVPEWVLALFVEASRGGESLVALAGGEIVGHGMYVRSGDGRAAEIAVLVEDSWQSRGIGKLLLHELAGGARIRGIETFTGEVLGENRRMIGLFEAAFAEVEYTIRDGSYHVRVPLRAPEPATNPAKTIQRAA